MLRSDGLIRRRGVGKMESEHEEILGRNNCIFGSGVLYLNGKSWAVIAAQSISDVTMRLVLSAHFRCVWIV